MPLIGEITEVQRTYREFDWIIPDFFSLSVKDDKCYCSPPFFFHGEYWRFLIYPNGVRELHSNRYIGLFLYRNTSDPPIELEFDFGLKFSDGVTYELIEHFGIFKNENSKKGVHRYISRARLKEKKAELVPDDVLTVFFRLEDKKCTEDSDNLLISWTRNVIEQNKIMEPTGKVFESMNWMCNWRIPDFFSLSEECYCSPPFFIFGASWRLKIYPNKRSKVDSNRYISLYLLKKPCDPPIDLMYCLDLNPTHGKTYEKRGVFKYESTSSGFFKFISRSMLMEKKSEIMSDDDLTIHCYLWVSKSTEDTTLSSCKEASQPGTGTGDNSLGVPDQMDLEPHRTSDGHSCVTDVNHLLIEKKGVDVTFVLETPSGKTEVFAHQLVLAVRSSYFSDEFYGTERKQKHQIIPLEGIVPKAFQEMIRYCYDNEPCLKTAEEACALFRVATEFKVISLINVCRTFLLNAKMEPGNVFSILKVSAQMEDQNLSNMCLKVLIENTRDVMAYYELYDVTPVMVRIILELPEMSLSSEYELIDWIFKWVKSKSEEKDSEHKNSRDYLVKLILQGMNFLSLSGEEFAKLCKDYPSFLSPEEKASISLNLLLPHSSKMPDWYKKNLKSRVYTGSRK